MRVDNGIETVRGTAQQPPTGSRPLASSGYPEWEEPRGPHYQPQDVRLCNVARPEEEIEEDAFHDAMEDIYPLLPMHHGYIRPSTSGIARLNRIRYDTTPAAAQVTETVYKAREMDSQQRPPDACLDPPG